MRKGTTYSAGGCQTETGFVFLEEVQKVCKGCKSDFIETAVKSGGRRSG